MWHITGRKAYMYGIKIDGSSDNTIMYNSVMNTTYSDAGYVVFILLRFPMVIMLVIILFFKNQGSGLYLYGYSNTITHNNIANNTKYGVTLVSSSHDNDVMFNVIANNSDRGVNIVSSSGADNYCFGNYIRNNVGYGCMLTRIIRM